MRSTRFITAGLAAVLALAIVPAWAAAASPLVDDSVTDFSAGTPGTDTWAVEPGSVRLRPATVSENFDGSTLPAGVTATPTAAATVGAGALTVDGGIVQTDATFSPGQSLEFRGMFGGEAFQHVGLANNLETGPWALFSTGNGAVPGLYARTLNGTAEDTRVGDVDSLVHTYRIDWSLAGVNFSVDGVPIPSTTPPVSISSVMRPVASDLTAGVSPAKTVELDWLAMGTFPTTGKFESRIQDAGDTRAVWGVLTQTVTGSNASFETRSGNTPTPDATWSAFESRGPGNAIQSPSGRYIQYRATLGAATQSLDSVSIAYNIDDVAPTAAIGGVQVSGTTATVTFNTTGTDLGRFECSLDGGAFATCTSPKQFTGLAAGSHSVAVRAVDKVGNVGNANEKSFSVEAPPASGRGGGAAPPPVAVAADTTAPKVTLKALSARASKRGTLTFRVGCPATETRCKTGIALKVGRSTLAHKTITVNGGKTAKVTLKLTKSARRQLATRGKLKVSAVVTATDAAGNKSTSTVKMTLKAPSR